MTPPPKAVNGVGGAHDAAEQWNPLTLSVDGQGVRNVSFSSQAMNTALLPALFRIAAARPLTPFAVPLNTVVVCTNVNA